MVDLVLLHGPPASGKYTTASELSALTGARVFHNHLTLDVAKALYDFGTPEFWELVRELRLLSFQSYFRNGNDAFISTWCYEHPKNYEFFNTINPIAESENGRVLPVYLSCDLYHLEDRVANPGRKRMKKICSVEKLRSDLQQNTYSRIPSDSCVEINSGVNSAKYNANYIASNIFN